MKTGKVTQFRKELVMLIMACFSSVYILSTFESYFREEQGLHMVLFTGIILSVFGKALQTENYIRL